MDNQKPTNEIDLGRFLQILWSSKLLITIVTLVVACGAVAYAFLTPPTYRTTVQTLPPTSGGLASYNMASQLTGVAIGGIVDGVAAPGIEPLTSQTAYRTFLRYLNSTAIREDFFERFYLPAQAKNKTARDKEKAWKRLTNDLKIKLPKPDEYEAQLALEGRDPQTIAKWANLYVELAIDAAREDLLDDLEGQVTIRKQSLKEQIATLRNVATITRLDHISRLESGLAIAESIGLEEPPANTPLIAIGKRDDNGAFANGSMLYLRGAKALRSELEQLRLRKNDDAYISELPDLLKKIALIENIDLRPENLAVATIDRAANIPEEPIRPQKALIVILAIVLGSLLGVFIALTGNVIRTKWS